MKRVIQIIALALAVAVGFWLFRMLFPDDADVIREQLTEMATDASFASDESPITKISKAGKLANRFTIDAEIRVKLWGRREVSVNGRTEIRQAAVGVRSVIASLKITIDRIEITVAEDRRSAQVSLSLTARSSRREEPWTEGMDVQMRRGDGDWLISSVANRQIIRQ